MKYAILLIIILFLAACDQSNVGTDVNPNNPPTEEEVLGCTDSDGGIDITRVGTTRDNVDTFTDSCADAKKVKEYYCDAGSVKVAERICTGVCDAGKCVAQPVKTVGACTDSDGGVVYQTKGKVVDENGNVFTDYCEPGYLQEAVCDTFGFGKFKPIDCDVCNDGVCQQLEVKGEDLCSDSDGGPIIETYGEVTDANGRTFKDECGSGSFIQEAICDDFGYGKLKTFDCDVCQNGVCIQVDAPEEDDNCVDTDNGVFYDVKGTVTDSRGRTGTDYCKYNTALIEYVCDSYGFIKERTYNCDCVDGACID